MIWMCFGFQENHDSRIVLIKDENLMATYMPISKEKKEANSTNNPFFNPL